MDNVVNRPISFCTYFIFRELLISMIALHFPGLASMPRCVSMNPKNLPIQPRAHIFSGSISFHDFSMP